MRPRPITRPSASRARPHLTGERAWPSAAGERGRARGRTCGRAWPRLTGARAGPSAAGERGRDQGRTRGGGVDGCRPDVHAPPEYNVPMEPHTSVAIWNDGILTMYESTQGVHSFQAGLAPLFGLERNGSGSSRRTWAADLAQSSRFTRRPSSRRWRRANCPVAP